jgi:hypothetical protein
MASEKTPLLKKSLRDEIVVKIPEKKLKDFDENK